MTALLGRRATPCLNYWFCWSLCCSLLGLLLYWQTAKADTLHQDAALEAQLDKLVGIGRYPTDLKALQQLADKAAQTDAFDTYIRAQGNLLLWQGLEQRETEQALTRAKVLAQQAQQQGSANAQAEILAVQCEILLQQGQSVAYMQLLPELERVLTQVNNPRLQYHINLLISRVWQTAGQQELALEYALTAQKASRQLQDQFQLQRRLRLNAHIARTETALLHYQAALDLTSSSIKEALEQQEHGELAELYLLSGYVEQHQHGPTNKALAEFKQAASWARKTNNSRALLMALNNVGANLLLQQQYPQAEQYLQQAQQVVSQDSMAPERLVLEFNLGYLQVLQGRYASGIEVMIKTASAFRQVARPDQVAHLMTHMADAYGRMGQFQQQAEVLAEKLQLLSTYYNDERARIVNEMQIRYQSNDQALQVELLNQRLALQQQAYQNQKRLNWMIAGLSAAAFVILLVLWLSNKKIKQINNLLSEKNAQLHQLSLRDPLTGLKNRRAIEVVPLTAGQHHTVGEQRRAKPAQPMALLVLLDIDRFKLINDTYGHGVGDEVLLAFASRLKQFCRADDQVLRWGGEEFLLILPALTANDAPGAVQRLVQVLSSTPVETGAGPLPVTASGGFLLLGTAIPHDKALWDWQLTLADLLLYRAKQQGRNRLYGWLAMPSEHNRQDAASQLECAQAELSCVEGPQSTTAS